jgi:ribosome biogenesis GTPase
VPAAPHRSSRGWPAKRHGGRSSRSSPANVDVVFLTAGLDGDFNAPPASERYLTLGWEERSLPGRRLTKADLCDDVDAAVVEVESIAIGVPVHPVSNLTGEGIDALALYLAEGRTIAALGSSGVGKSSLVNRLAGEELMATGDVRADGRGRHTTTSRQLLLLPGGGLYLDTPGMRELRLWESEEGLASTFDDVTAAATRCRFTDCSHEREPDCGVQAALADGTLDRERYVSWRKLQNELRLAAIKQDARLRSEARKEWRRFARSQRKASW